MVFQWRVKTFPADAQVVGEVLTDIEKRTGEINPKTVVDESRDVEAPLHKCFEWDDVVAAEKHRITQAQQMIRNIVVVSVGDSNNTEVEPVRAFVSIRDIEPNSRRYVSISLAISNDYYNEQILLQALKELENFRRKYSNISKFTEVIRAIDTVLKDK